MAKSEGSPQLTFGPSIPPLYLLGIRKFGSQNGHVWPQPPSLYLWPASCPCFYVAYGDFTAKIAMFGSGPTVTVWSHGPALVFTRHAAILQAKRAHLFPQHLVPNWPQPPALVFTGYAAILQLKRQCLAPAHMG